ncbi:MAG: hypothetical protein CR994_01395 [Maribacter sp.]|nr:MAG: hypothetical protein CR994_01395 [Maribacter sp.]
MTHKLIDYKKLNHHLATRLIEAYPNGYGDDDIITFKNAHGEIIETVELRTDDAVYLVKISKCFANFISNFEENMEKGLEPKQQDIFEDEIGDNEFELHSGDDFDGEL